MKQVLQQLKSGELELADMPAPQVRAGHVLIQSRASLISAGTERMLVEFGKANLIAKARSQPDKVRQVLDKIKADGLMPTMQAVFARLDEPLPLGYCNAGVVLEVGEGVTDLRPGDRVASNAPHAELACVPRNLCAKVPDGVTDEEAAFTVLGSIGLQGIRLLEPTLGESVVVTGLGLIGLMAVQMLRANGCRVLGIDVDPARLELARQFGAEVVDLPGGADPVAAAMAFSDGRGVDGVLITASTKSNEIIHQAAQMCRKRGRIVLVGVIGLELTRSDFYEKELTFQVSCSYGPGRYDPRYEGQGQDYPFGFVRWTERRNFEAILELLAAKRLTVEPLISRRVPHGEAAEAYRILTDEREALGIVLQYPHEDVSRDTVITLAKPAIAGSAAPGGRAVVGVIGGGNFSRLVGLPALRDAGARLAAIADLNPVAATQAGRKFGIERTTTDHRTLLEDSAINTVIVFTRHNVHAPLVIEALEAGKHVFVEKPLCLNAEELERIRGVYEQSAGRKHLLVGFNRRFSAYALKMRSLLQARAEPVTMHMMVNAGVSPPDSWVHNPLVGGGRIIGEACHWIDLTSFLAGAPVVRVSATKVGASPALAVREDKMAITLEFGDGSIATVDYYGNGHKSYPKETLEVMCDGKVLRLDNFQSLRGFGWSGFRRMGRDRGGKGHREEFRRFISAVTEGGQTPISFDEIENVMRATFAAVESAETGRRIDIPRVVD